jgi:hypothetical protein
MSDLDSQSLESAYSNLTKADKMSKFLRVNRYLGFVSNAKSVNIYCFFIGIMTTWVFLSFITGGGFAESLKSNEELNIDIFVIILFLAFSGLFGIVNFMILDGIFGDTKKPQAITSDKLSNTLKLVVSDLGKIVRIDYRLYPSFIEQLNTVANKIKISPSDHNYLSIESSKLAILDFADSSSRLLIESKVD